MTLLTGLQSYEVYETVFVIDYSTYLASFYHVFVNYMLYISLDLKRLRISANNLLNVHFLIVYKCHQMYSGVKTKRNKLFGNVKK